MNILKIIAILIVFIGCKEPSIKRVPATVEDTFVSNVNTLQPESEEQSKTNNISKTLNSHLKKYTISVDNQKQFKNWEYGEATIFLVTQPFKRKNKEEIQIGKVEENGSFYFNLPDTVSYDRTISSFFTCEMNKTVTKAEYKSPNTGLVSAYLSVRKNENEIGLLSLATSKQQEYNNSPFGKYHGAIGYRLKLWFADEITGIYSICNRSIEATNNAETIKEITITDTYNLSFNKGWNFVKTETIDNQMVGEVSYYKLRNYTVESEIPTNAKWIFKEL